MLDVVLFGEDRAHHRIVGSLVQRLASESRIAVRMDWQNSRGGHGRTLRKYQRYLRELERMPLTLDLLVVATDANCLGLKRRIQEFSHAQAHIPTVLAIPDRISNAGCCLTERLSKPLWGAGARRRIRNAAAIATSDYSTRKFRPRAKRRIWMASNTLRKS